MNRGLDPCFNVSEFLPDADFLEIKVALEEIFEPANAPLHYDSKIATNMVGLKNLGATCYLNALLQVILS